MRKLVLVEIAAELFQWSIALIASTLGASTIALGPRLL